MTDEKYSMGMAHRNEELHLILEGVSQSRHLQGEDVLDVPVQGKQAAEPQHMPNGTAQSLDIQQRPIISWGY